MSQRENPDPATSEWREKVCALCCSCSRLLAFMEGPVCDGCLDLDEVRPVGDKYYGMKTLEKRRLEEERRLEAEEDDFDEFSGLSPDPFPGKSGVRLVVRDALAVDLSCLGKIVYFRETKKTIDTMSEGLRPQKAR